MKSDLDINPSAAVKIKLDKIYGKTELYISESIKKPSKLNASLIVDVIIFFK